MNKTNKLTVATNLSASDVHCIQTMIEFFEVRIYDDDEDMYRAFCVTLDDDEVVTHEDMNQIGNYLRGLREELDKVDEHAPEYDNIITIEQNYNVPGRLDYYRVDNMYEDAPEVTLSEQEMVIVRAILRDADHEILAQQVYEGVHQFPYTMTDTMIGFVSEVATNLVNRISNALK